MKLPTLCCHTVFLFLFLVGIVGSACTQVHGQQYQLGFVPGNSPHGVLVQTVTQGGPMTKLIGANGQQVYAEARDVVVSVNGQRTPNVQVLRSVLANLSATGGRASIQLMNHRDGVIGSYSVQATAVQSSNQSSSPTLTGQPASYSGVGVTAAPGRVGNTSGMVIQSAASNSPLLRMRDATGNQIKVDPGDLIVAIGGRATTSGQSLVNAYQNAGQSFQISLYDSRTGRVTQFTASKGGAGPKVQPPPQRTARIFVLMLGMTDQNIASSVSASMRRMAGIVQTQIQRSTLGAEPVTLHGSNYTANHITQAIRGFNAGPNDAIFVYYIGHGSYENGGHVLNLSRGNKLARATLSNELRAKNARLTVLVSESCSNSTRGGRTGGDGSAPTSLKRNLQTMLLNGRGVVNVNSSSRGQFGFGNPEGGYFSRFVHSYLEDAKSGVTWASLVKYASEQQSATYKQIRSKAISDMQQQLNAGVLDDRGKKTLRAFQGQASLDAQVYELNIR